MKTNFLLGLFLLCHQISAQVSITDHSVTRAVVIGISDYQDKDIPDLEYAHRDAGAFAAWLGSPAGGTIAEEQIKVLLNQEATIGRIVEVLGWLIEHSKAGDQAIIYFSGHGDVETLTSFNRGFLLAHNAPSRNYMAGGVLPLGYLEDIVKTLSQNNANVTVITDACRSGNLAGSGVNGSQFTSSQLARRFANEIKILSCQPEEYSSEGPQWGGGHGAFSYHLIDGLYGLADQNTDFKITLSEVDRYLGDHVSMEVAPLLQTPMTFGNRNTAVAFVNNELLEKRKKQRSEELPMIAAVNTKSLQDLILAHADSSILQLYASFNTALEEKAFFEPVEACADTFYKQLIREVSIAPLHAAMSRRFAAYLQDDAQDAINAILKVEPEAMTTARVLMTEKYKVFPKYLERSAELLGETHYMYKSLKARALFFEGVVQWYTYYLSADETIAKGIMDKYRQSLALESYAPHTYHFMSSGFATMLNEPDSAILYTEQAVQLAPSWIYPYVSLAYFLMQKYQRFDDAKILLEKCKAMDSEHPMVLQILAAWHYYQNQYEEAVALYDKALEKDSSNAYIFMNLGTIAIKRGKYEEADSLLQLSILADSTLYYHYFTLGFLYDALKRPEDAEKVLLKSIERHPRFITGRKKLGVIYYYQGRKEEARNIWLEAHELKPFDIELCLNVALVSIDLEDKQNALVYLEKAFKNGKQDYEEVIVDFVALKDMDAYQALLKKYFPEEFKAKD